MSLLALDHPSATDTASATSPELVALARTGDRAAFEAIVRAHAPAVYGIVLGYGSPAEADDLVQEVFLKVVQGLPGFDGRSSLGTWIFRIATNVGLNHLRTRRRKPPAKALDVDVASRSPSPADVLGAAEERAAFRAALDELPDELRAVVVLRVHRGLSFEDIGTVLGIPRPTAESRMARAKDRLRVLLRSWLPEEAPR